MNLNYQINKVIVKNTKSCRTYLLLLLSNVLLKVRTVHFKADSTISGAFQCLACSAGAPLICTSSTINFLGVERPFLDEVGPSSVVWRNCRVARCVGAFSQLLKWFSKLLAWIKELELCLKNFLKKVVEKNRRNSRKTDSTFSLFKTQCWKRVRRQKLMVFTGPCSTLIGSCLK